MDTSSTPHDSGGSATPSNTSDPLNLINSRASSSSQASDVSLAEQEVTHKFTYGERGEKFRRHIHFVVLTGIYVVAALLLTMIIVRAWHFTSPEKWKWLNENQCNDLERILFSGVIVSLAGSYFKRYNLLDKK